jgi:glycosyltransferase involved in cell wall biosynthesis
MTGSSQWRQSGESSGNRSPKVIVTATNSAGEAAVVAPTRSRLLRVAIICDFAEERWPSMDLVGNMLHSTLANQHSDHVTASLVRPKMPFSSAQHPDRISRLFGRVFHYPRELRRIRGKFDLFHIVDHSYAHLVHDLPPERTVVTCHDIDAFQCLLQPELKRSMLFRGTFQAMTRRILTGMQRAAHVTCDTEATRQEILTHSLLPCERLTVVHNGVHPDLRPEPDYDADSQLTRLLGRLPGTATELVHVGSTIARKRIDTLLSVFADLRQHRSDVRLLRIGGEFTASQHQLAQSLGILKHIDVLPRIDERVLAAAYRRAAVLLQTSDAEGFGLPVIEAMACGTPAIASDIAPLREVGGSAAEYCPIGDTPQFLHTVLHLLKQRDDEPSAWQLRRANSLTQASRFTWTAYAAKMVEIYHRVSGQ